jgi:hypothetical protein
VWCGACVRISCLQPVGCVSFSQCVCSPAYRHTAVSAARLGSPWAGPTRRAGAAARDLAMPTLWAPGQVVQPPGARARRVLGQLWHSGQAADRYPALRPLHVHSSPASLRARTRLECDKRHRPEYLTGSHARGILVLRIEGPRGPGPTPANGEEGRTAPRSSKAGPTGQAKGSGSSRLDGGRGWARCVEPLGRPTAGSRSGAQ